MVTASCHCGAVQLEIDLSDEPLSPVRCNCSYCIRRGAAMIGVPLKALRVVRGAENLQLYTFHSNTAQHYFCKTCGIYIHHRRRIDTQQYGVNIGCIEGLDVKALGEIPWLDGRNHPSDA